MNTLTFSGKEYPFFHALDSTSWNEQARINVLLSLGIFMCYDGSIFIRHWIRNKKRFYLQQFFSITKAISSQDRIIGHYIMSSDDGRSEFSLFSNLAYIIADIAKAHGALLKDNPANNGSTNIEEAITLLTNCHLQLKDKIRKQLEMLMSEFDSLGRPNPGAKLAVATSAKKNVKSRGLQIHTSIGLARERRHALRMESIFEEKNLLLAKALLESLLRDPEIGGEDKRRKIGQIRYHLQSIWLLPYREEAEKLKELLPK